MLKKILPSLFMIAFGAQANDIYVFKPSADISLWQVVNDGVMGGLSKGSLSQDTSGYGVFSGNVSLDNNGGFTSIRYRLQEPIANTAKKIVIRLKGDGKKYQFRLKADPYDRHSYVDYFTTNGNWQTIELNLADMTPTFRGRQLDIPTFGNQSISEVGFLIANKRAEKFNPIIDFIKGGFNIEVQRTRI